MAFLRAHHNSSLALLKQGTKNWPSVSSFCSANTCIYLNCLLCVTGNLGSGYKAINKTDEVSALMELTVVEMRKKKNKQFKEIDSQVEGSCLKWYGKRNPLG